MSDPITTFFDAWSETDAKARSAAVHASVAKTGSYADPRAPDPMIGPDAIADYVGMFSANAPGWTATVVSCETTAGVSRATVAFGGKGPDGSDMVQMGQYFIEASEGHITRMVGFPGTGTPSA